MGATSTLEPATRSTGRGRHRTSHRTSPEAAPEPGRLEDLPEKRWLHFEKLPAGYSLLQPGPAQSSLHGVSDCSWVGLGSTSGELNDLSTFSKALRYDRGQ